MLVGLLGRHLENPENKTEDFRGRTDEPLDEKGMEQAPEMVDFIMSRYAVERIVSSPLLRALETARFAADAFGVPIIQERALMATDMGFLTGMNQEKFADVYQFFLDNPEKVIPDGESIDGLHERVADFFEADLKNGGFTYYSAHSSTGVVLANLAAGTRDLKPGIDHITDTGGLAEIHWTGANYEIVPV